MSNITATINNVSYPVHHASGFNLSEVLESRDVLTFTVIDSAGTAVFTRGMPVVFSDTVSGVLYNGYVQSDSPQKLSPNPTSTIRLHTITCMPPQYDVDKRSNEKDYTEWYAGDIATDMVINGNLAQENIRIAAALRRETSTADFSTGTLIGTVASAAIPTNDGDLELAKAGTDLNVTENTTAQFATGTLTNVQATNNTLIPTTVSGMQVTVTLPTTQSAANFNIFYWTGSQALGTNDTWNYDIWISSTSPQIMAASYFLFTDGSISGGMVDSNGRDALSTSDASTYAKDTWYTRTISTSTWNGKTISAVVFKFGGASQGTYTAYIKNAYLTSGPVFLATNATALQTSPVTVWTYLYYNPSSIIAQLVQLFDPANASRVSTAYSLSGVGLVKSSSISWNAATPNSSSMNISVSYDNGTTYATCTNNAALPALPAGSNVSASTFLVKEAFNASANPTTLPTLLGLNISVLSAPNATKSDIITTYATQTALNTGTYASTQSTASGQLELNQVTRNWNDTLITNQTSFFTAGTSQSAGSGAYVISCNASAYGTSRLDFVGSMVDLTIDCDVTISNGAYASITYRQYYWSTTDKTYGYVVSIYKDAGTSGLFILERGTNGDPGNTFAGLASITKTVTPGTTYHIKIVVSGTTHLAYFNNESTPSINVTDTVFVQAGGIGLRSLNNIGSGTTTGTFDNLVVSQAGFGTWTSPSVSISSLGTSGGSAISWVEQNTGSTAAASVLVQSTVDGGSTYQTCTNGGAVPNIPAGTNLSGKSIKLLVTLSSIYPTVSPILTNLFWRVLGQYPGSSGTRTTAPYGIDNMVRANSGSWGTAQNGQAWNKTGTGTVAISSNTATIANTTGDVDEKIGSVSATDQEATVQVKLSASGIQDGIKLRYVSSTKYYKLALSTTGLSIIKNTGSGESTLATQAGTYLTNTWYYLRFRVVGDGPVSLYGKAWLGDGTLVEPGVSNGVMSTTSPMWTVTTTD